MYDEVEDVRAFMHEVVTRRKTDEQVRRHLHARRWVWLAAALWSAVLVLSCLALYKLIR